MTVKILPMKSLALVLFLVSGIYAFAQDTEPILSDRRNTIKVDLTSYWLFRQAAVFSYERVISNKHSYGFIVGFQRLPPQSILGSRVGNVRETHATGLKVGAEYRFYLAKENRFAPPRGIYIGPYVTFNNFNNGRDIEVDNNGVTEPARVSSRFDILSFGIQLGYQFVFNDRWTIDLSLMGPSFTNYRAKFELTGNYTFDPDDISNEMLDELVSRFPGLSDLMSGGSVVSQGKVDRWAYGYRYEIQVGYRFGRKKQ